MGSLQASPRRDLNFLSTQELVDLLLTKTTELLDSQSKKMDGIEFQKLLQEVDEITRIIELRKRQEKSN